MLALGWASSLMLRPYPGYFCASLPLDTAPHSIEHVAVQGFQLFVLQGTKPVEALCKTPASILRTPMPLVSEPTEVVEEESEFSDYMKDICEKVTSGTEHPQPHCARRLFLAGPTSSAIVHEQDASDS